MKQSDYEYKRYSHLKRMANDDEIYFLNILDNDGLSTINLNQYNQTTFTFGKNNDNDLVLNSDVIDEYQGVLELTEYGLLIKNNSSQVEMIGNNNKAFDDFYMSEGSFAKFISANYPHSQGVLMLMSISKTSDEWKQYSISSNSITLGSSSSCDVTIPPNGVAKKHATIHRSQGNFYINDEGSLNGVHVNGQKIPRTSNFPLNDLDVIFIGNTKFILYRGTLIYQIYNRGIQLDAVDIVKQVRIKFKVKEISSHINMSIKPSEFVAFVGGSGAGKSTFMKCISGVNQPTYGRVYLDGENLYENYQDLKYNIGYVPQDDIVYPNLTLHDMLQYSAKLRMPDNTDSKTRYERIKEVLNIVQLSDFENSYIRQLSGGQRKRASIAVELIADPNLFFLDEPTSGLDPGTERSVMQTLRTMADMGKTIILVTHNTLNLHLCDKVAFFGTRGRLCFYGPPQEALEFFNVTDFVDIYTLLNENTDLWYDKFNNKNSEITIEKPPEKKENKMVNQKKSFFKQFTNLTMRYIKLIANDWQQLILLFAQAPIIAYLLTLIAGDTLYSIYDDTKSILFSMSCSCIWLGLMNSAQEICKEKVIVQKEYMADLKLSAYILSKFIVQAFLAFIQAFLITVIFQNIAGKSSNSILINAFWDMLIFCFLAILSSATLGLFISALVKNTNIAMTLIPLILVPQLLFSGMIFKLEGFTEFISNFILCRWTVEGLGTSVNLNDLTHTINLYNPLYEIEPENYFLFTTEHMAQVIAVIITMTLVLIIASYFALRKNIKNNM